jgi:hypothetical protein
VVLFIQLFIYTEIGQAVIKRSLRTFPHVGCVGLTGGLAGDEDRNEEVRVVWCGVCVCVWLCLWFMMRVVK